MNYVGVLFVVLLYGLICYLIGEFFGRAKHIGRWWTMFLFWSAPIPLIGLLALIFSPSAKKTQTSKYNSIWLVLGVLFLLLSIKPLYLIINSSQYYLRHWGYIFFTAYVIHGIYFILLGTNKIINSNPKYYFKDMKFNLPEFNIKKKTEGDTAILMNDKIEDLEIDENESPTQPIEINENDEQIQLQKLFDLGVVTLEEFDAKKILIEEKRIAEDILRQEKLEAELAKENFKKKVEENKLALKSLESLRNKGILTYEEYNSKIEFINESEKSDKRALDKLLYNQRNIPENEDEKNDCGGFGGFANDIFIILFIAAMIILN